ncbi:hypothetical protein SAMN02745130_01496 [Thiothrix eikelboomii]|uniref:Anti-sigma-K factor rskA n=1 Tax=Thiothrix eikelboomii TaxID=92487 RepID=A0A1T4WDA6_9GAMM|nr:anti-sigma factor [Thiothrix eikelboomii]SKA75270.1 hypothetical protein SAMN02745130_01496 [Thiothrix eikelboomii]
MNWKQVINKYKYLLLAGIIFVLLVFGGQLAYREWIPSSSVITTATAQQYTELKQASGTKGGSWLRSLNTDIQAVQGDLLWNSAQQLGMVRLVNLPDPKLGYQYHIWAYDAHRPSDQPISVLVLDRGSGQQEWYLPLTAPESIPNPYKFELTLEPLATQPQASAKPLVLLMVQF